MSLIRESRLDEAESLLGEVLAATPRQPDALHLMGMCRHERADAVSAERLIREAIDSWPDGDPQVCVAWNNLGNVLVESGQPDAAIDAYRAALDAMPEASGTWNNLSGLLRRLGRLDEAAQAAQHAVDAAPGDPHAWFTLARAHIELGDVHAGLRAHAQGVALAPRDVVGREEVLRSLAVLGHREAAATLWNEWLEEQPDDPIALHHRAACVGSPPPRAADAYVQALFDDFASSFDAKLAKLQYRAPALIVHALGERLGADTAWGDVADLGCGTGLAGLLLRPRVGRLVGVDLSTGMLQAARLRDVYDECTQADLVSFLRGRPASFDVVVAADVLCYFGVLDDVISAASAALRAGGTIAFTVESLPAESLPAESLPAESLPDASADWSLALTGRYTHSRGYIAAAMAGFDGLSIEPCELRLEAGRPVAGLLVIASRAA